MDGQHSCDQCSNAEFDWQAVLALQEGNQKESEILAEHPECANMLAAGWTNQQTQGIIDTCEQVTVQARALNRSQLGAVDSIPMLIDKSRFGRLLLLLNARQRIPIKDPSTPFQFR